MSNGSTDHFNPIAPPSSFRGVSEGKVASYLSKYKLEDFKVIYPDTLFPLNWEALKVGRCPLCSCLLKQPRSGKVLMCRSKKHPKPFIIKRTRLDEMLVPKRG